MKSIPPDTPAGSSAKEGDDALALKRVLFYDGNCALCHGAVGFLLPRLRTASRLTFAPLQGTAAAHLLGSSIRPSDPEAVVLFDRGQIWSGAEAILHCASDLRAPFRPLLQAGYLISPGLRARLYRWIAHNRIGWFGRASHCPLPDKKRRWRLLS
ncbi:DUF393 domain-containing protein [bacterium]|nr:DUF393 domain-containing protein [bacterium]